MKTQIGVARRTYDMAEGGAALAGIDENLTAMSRLTNQLLTLGRVDHDRASLQSGRVDLAAVARDAVAEAAPRALDRGVELVLQADGRCAVMATSCAGAGNGQQPDRQRHPVCRSGRDRDGLRSEGRRTRRCSQWTTTVPAWRRRNCRSSSSGFAAGATPARRGSGLGLSIVAEIAQMFDGAVELAAPSGGKGFRVVVRLPLAEHAGPRPPQAVGEA